MKIKSIKIHNFRSLKDITIDCQDYLIFNGENNAGKSNLITALRLFYEDGIKYNKSNDFPKFNTVDNESWIEMEYIVTDDEFSLLKEDYKLPNNTLRVRKYFQSDEPGRVKNGQSNIFSYENGQLSQNLFYGAKNVSKAKLGEVIYIPEVSKSDDNFKLSGPSPFRNILNFVMKKVVKSSKSFKNLEDSFNSFNKLFPKDESSDGISLGLVKEDLNAELEEWGISFGLNINPVKPEDIVKNLVSHYFEDENFPGSQISHNNFGQGLQRHLIYSLIKLSSKYKDKTLQKKKDFSPDFKLILFEEPESFLHPTQQALLNFNLINLSKEDEQQIFITTHSPKFISSNIQELSSFIRLCKDKGVTCCYQLKEYEMNNLFNDNNDLIDFFNEVVENKDSKYNQTQIRKAKPFTREGIGKEELLEEESIKYILWLDSERASMFFSKTVIICEGASEKALFDYLLENEWHDLYDKHIYFLDAMGKYNIHRYMNLFKNLGISHSVLMDSDSDNEIQELVNSFIFNNLNEYTNKIDSFESDIEGYLEIEKPSRKDLKPANILRNYINKNISNDKLNNLKEKVINLL